MKRTMCALLAVLMLVGCFMLPACKKTEEQEVLREKYLREIQEGYDAEMAKEENQTTLAMTQLTEQYAHAWKTAAEDCYESIMTFDGKFSSNESFDSIKALRDYVKTEKETFDEDYQTQCDAYLKSLQATHGDGTIVGLSMAVFQYGLQKDWALTLADLHDTHCK